MNILYFEFSFKHYLAWPVHIQLSIENIEQTAKCLDGVASLVCLDLYGNKIPMHQRQQMVNKCPSDMEWVKGLTAMRSHMLKETSARIVLGGRTESYKGSMPGIGEEALLSLNGSQPLYIVGGFGGCARDIAESIGLVEPSSESCRNWARREEFDRFSAVHLNNGLSHEDNATLAETPHIYQAVGLILQGLSRISKNTASLAGN